MGAMKTASVEGTTIHDLRYTAPSFRMSARADVTAVQVILGHSTATMTMGLYGLPVLRGGVAAMERLPAIPLMEPPRTKLATGPTQPVPFRPRAGTRWASDLSAP